MNKFLKSRTIQAALIVSLITLFCAFILILFQQPTTQLDHSGSGNNVTGKKTEITQYIEKKDGFIVQTLLMEKVVRDILLINEKGELTTFGEHDLSYDLFNVYYEMLNSKAIFISSAIAGSKHEIATVKSSEFKGVYSDWEPNVGYVATEDQKSDACFLLYESVDQKEFDKEPRRVAHIRRGPLFYGNLDQCYKQKSGDFDGFERWIEQIDTKTN